MKRYLILAGAFVMQLCLGATYSWSVFVKPLRDLSALSQGTAQLPFTVFYFAFPATMIVAGSLLPVLGPRKSALLGGALFGGGWMFAALGSFGFPFTVIGIGVIAGVGVGFAYIVPIAVGVRWFPGKEGLVTGVAVAGFGGGAALVSQLSGWLLTFVGPFTVFLICGSAFLVLTTVAGSVMSYPASVSLQRETPLPVRSILLKMEFRYLYAAMVAGLAAGFAVNANLKDLAHVLAGGTGTLAVGVFAVSNASGRIAWGYLFDRVRGGKALQLNLILQAVVLAGGVWFIADYPLAFAALTGFNYGGVLVLYASTVARVWGRERVGQVYGLLFSANIVASPAPVLAGMVFDSYGVFWPAMITIAVLMVVGAVLVRQLDKKSEKGGISR